MCDFFVIYITVGATTTVVCKTSLVKLIVSYLFYWNVIRPVLFVTCLCNLSINAHLYVYVAYRLCY